MANRKKVARATRAVEDEQHPTTSPPTSGTLDRAAESGRMPVTEPGLPIEPEELGRQFLRDATEQDNFESEAHWEEREPGAYPLGQMVSEATLENAGQAGIELPRSDALDTETFTGVTEDEDLEPETDGVELMSTAVHESSLFDQPTQRGGTHAPELDTDEAQSSDGSRVPPGADEEAYRAEVERLRTQLRKNRDRREIRADEASWQTNRRTDETDGRGGPAKR